MKRARALETLYLKCVCHEKVSKNFSRRGLNSNFEFQNEKKENFASLNLNLILIIEVEVSQRY